MLARPRFGVVVSRFNHTITNRLLSSCLRTLKKAGVRDTEIRTVEVPGGYEIPWAAQELALTRKYRAVICLGAVLRGQTPQNTYISQSSIHHLQEISLRTRVPCILGIITPNNPSQALSRTRGTKDRGREAALAALEVARLKI